MLLNEKSKDYKNWVEEMYLNPTIENMKNEDNLERNFIEYVELLNTHPNTIEYLFFINNVVFLLFSRFSNPFKFMKKSNEPEISYHIIEFDEALKIRIHETRYLTSFGKINLIN